MNFVIFCYARTGSYYLVDYLNKQRDIRCFGEVYKPSRIELDDDIKTRLGVSGADTDAREARPVNFYKKLLSNSGSMSFGFKIFPSHNKEALEHLAKDSSIKKVFLSRNPVQTYISQKVAVKTGVWVDKDGVKKQIPNITVNLRGLVNHITSRYEAYLRIKSLACMSGVPLYYIDYNDVMAGGFEGLSKYLGREFESVRSDHNKIIREPYSNIVKNWQEVESLCDSLGVDENVGFLDFCSRL